MSDPLVLARLAAFQGAFSALLRTPLDRSGRSLHAPSERYDAGFVAQVRGDARARLAIYHRQYWFRLFTALQREFPLCARILGMWNFNGLAARYLDAHPPRHDDLQCELHAFVPFLEGFSCTEELHGVPAAAVWEAARIDRAFSRVFLAPEQAPLVRLPRAGLLTRQLLLAPTVEFVSERWPLLALRSQVMRDAARAPSAREGALALPPAHEEVRHWAVFRTAGGHGVMPLSPLAHRLFSLLAARPVGEALAELEAGCDPGARGGLPAEVQALLARSVELAFWRGTVAT